MSNNMDLIDAFFQPVAGSTQAVGDSAAAGSAGTVSRSDHKHALPNFGSPVSVTTANGNGVATTIARSDHAHTIAAGGINSATMFAAGVVDAAAIANRTRYQWIPISAFTTETGTPSAAFTDSAFHGYDFDAASTESMTVSWTTQADWSSGAIVGDIYWSQTVTAAGNVVLRFRIGRQSNGGLLNTGAQTDDTIAVDGTASKLKVSQMSRTATPAGVGDIIGIQVSRIGGDAADTYASDITIYGVRLSYTADS